MQAECMPYLYMCIVIIIIAIPIHQYILFSKFSGTKTGNNDIYIILQLFKYAWNSEF